jgi:hypothetical protein
MMDHPAKGGRCKRKKSKTRLNKRSMELRLPSSSLVQVAGRQERFCWRVPIPGDHGNCSSHAMNPGKQAQAPLGGIQTDHARTDAIELYGPGEQWLSKPSVMEHFREKGGRRAAIPIRDR